MRSLTLKPHLERGCCTKMCPLRPPGRHTSGPVAMSASSLLAEADRLDALAVALEQRAALKRRLHVLNASWGGGRDDGHSVPGSSRAVVRPVAAFCATAGSRVLGVGLKADGPSKAFVGVLFYVKDTSNLRLGTWRVAVGGSGVTATFLHGIGLSPTDTADTRLSPANQQRGVEPLEPRGVVFRGGSRVYVPAETLAKHRVWRWDGSADDAGPRRAAKRATSTPETDRIGPETKAKGAVRVLDADSTAYTVWGGVDSGAEDETLMCMGVGTVNDSVIVVSSDSAGRIHAWRGTDDTDEAPPRCLSAKKGPTPEDPAPHAQLVVHSWHLHPQAIALHMDGQRVSIFNLDTMEPVWDRAPDSPLASLHFFQSDERGQDYSMLVGHDTTGALRVGDVCWPIIDDPFPIGTVQNGTWRAVTATAASTTGHLAVVGAADGSVGFVKVNEDCSCSVLGSARIHSDSPDASDLAIEQIALCDDSSWALAADASGRATVFSLVPESSQGPLPSHSKACI